MVALQTEQESTRELARQNELRRKYYNAVAHALHCRTSRLEIQAVVTDDSDTVVVKCSVRWIRYLVVIKGEEPPQVYRDISTWQ